LKTNKLINVKEMYNKQSEKELSTIQT